MSRPEAMIGPGGPAASATGSSGPLRVVAERLSAEEAAAAEAAEVAEAERRAADLRRADLRAGRRGTPTAAAPPTAPVSATTVDATAAAAAAVATATAVATVARLRAPGIPTSTATDVVPARESTERAPVPFALPPRRSGFAELFALITGRRSTGRHRPDCVRRQPWSMFSPARGSRRRGRFGSRV